MNRRRFLEAAGAYAGVLTTHGTPAFGLASLTQAPAIRTSGGNAITADVA